MKQLKIFIVLLPLFISTQALATISTKAYNNWAAQIFLGFDTMNPFHSLENFIRIEGGIAYDFTKDINQTQNKIRDVEGFASDTSLEKSIENLRAKISKRLKEHLHKKSLVIDEFKDLVIQTKNLHAEINKAVEGQNFYYAQSLTAQIKKLAAHLKKMLDNNKELFRELQKAQEKAGINNLDEYIELIEQTLDNAKKEIEEAETARIFLADLNTSIKELGSTKTIRDFIAQYIAINVKIEQDKKEQKVGLNSQISANITNAKEELLKAQAEKLIGLLKQNGTAIFDNNPTPHKKWRLTIRDPLVDLTSITYFLQEAATEVLSAATTQDDYHIYRNAGSHQNLDDIIEDIAFIQKNNKSSDQPFESLAKIIVLEKLCLLTKDALDKIHAEANKKTPKVIDIAQYLKVLGLERLDPQDKTAVLKEVAKKYRRLSQQMHSDRIVSSKELSPEHQRIYAEKLAQLTKENKLSDYDKIAASLKEEAAATYRATPTQKEIDAALDAAIEKRFNELVTIYAADYVADIVRRMKESEIAQRKKEGRSEFLSAVEEANIEKNAYAQAQQNARAKAEKEKLRETFRAEAMLTQFQKNKELTEEIEKQALKYAAEESFKPIQEAYEKLTEALK